MKIKSLFIAFMLMLPFIANESFALSGNENTGSNNEYSFIQQYSVTAPLTLSVSTTGGNISVQGCDNNNVEVAFIVTQKGKLLDITFEQLKQYAEVEIINEKSNLSINVKNTLERGISIGFSIKAPTNSSTTLNTSGGNISLAKVSGAQSLQTSGGNLNLENIKGNVTAKTSGGNISISNSSADYFARTSGGNISIENVDGKMDVHTSGGNIDAENLKKGISAKTSGGNINLNNILEYVDVSTSGGEIKLENISGWAKAYTSGGDIYATMVKLSEKLELKTTGGSIHATVPAGLGLNLDLEAENVNPPQSNFVGSAKKDKVIGKLNGGGISVYLHTSGGDVTLNYK